VPQPPPPLLHFPQNVLFRYVKGEWVTVKEGIEWEIYNDLEDDDGFKWILTIGSEVEEEVLDELKLQYDTPGQRVTFLSPEQGIYTYFVASRAEYDRLGDQFDRALFENREGVAYSEDAVRKQMKGFEEWHAGRDDVDEFMSDYGEDPDAEGGGLMDVDEPTTCGRAAEDEFSFMNIGAGQNSFAVRGSHIDVFRNAHGGMTDAGVSVNVTPSRGGFFTPSKTLLTNQESKMLLLSPLSGNAPGLSTPPAAGMRTLYDMDLERESVVREYAFKKDDVEIPISDIVHDDKASGLTQAPTFLALDSNRICRFDTRTAEGVVADLTYDGGKDYARGTNFTCIATAGAGQVVTGSRDGRLRMYRGKDNLSRASTNLPSYGSPITAVDVTYDGKWVLATTDSFLMLVKTSFRDDKGNGVTGFTKSMNGGNSCAPRMLRLRGDDMGKVGPMARFSGGRFTWVTEQGTKERWIVARVGSHTIMWNMQRIVREEAKAEARGRGGMRVAGLNSYVLERSEEDVVDAHFVHDKWRHRNGDEAVVVLTRHNLFAGCDDDE